jgi:hypothetical protein
MKPTIALRNPWLGRLNAIVVIAAWACLAAFLILLVYGKLVTPHANAVPLMIAFAAFAAFVAIHIALSFWVRCPHCNKHLTSQGLTKPRYGEWSRTICKWFSGSVVCMHCGARVRTVDQ